MTFTQNPATPRRRRRATRRLAVAALTALIPLTAAGCSSHDDATSSRSGASTATSTAAGSTSSAAAGASSSRATMAAGVTVIDPWAKAAESGMSAAFGTLKNTGTTPVVITGARGDAGPVQLHVTVKTTSGMEMKETKAFTIPAGGSLTLAPGGSHLMFMNLTKALAAGDSQQLAVTFEDGSSAKLSFPVRAYDGAKEKYAGGVSSGASHPMDMSSDSGASGMSSMPGHSH